MNPLVLPWIAAATGIGFMTFMGFRAKREYRLRKSLEQAKAKAMEALMGKLLEEQRIATEQAAQNERQIPMFASRR